MLRIPLPIFCAALLAACGTGDDTAATAAPEKVLHVYNWVDYVAESTIQDFEARTGIRVVYDVYDASEVLETKLLTGSSGYDVVVPSGALTYRLIQAGALRKLDESKLAECGITWLDAPAEVTHVIPKEGAPLWCDMVAIPADAPHPENACLFLDYLMEPEVIADITNTVGQANGNAASLPYVAEAVRNNPSIYPSEVVYRRLILDRSWSPEQMHAVNRVWTRIKAGR